MTAAFLISLGMISVALFMFVITIPRKSEVVGFLRDRSTLETAYTMLVVCLLVVGGTAAIAEWTAR